MSLNSGFLSCWYILLWPCIQILGLVWSNEVSRACVSFLSYAWPYTFLFWHMFYQSKSVLNVSLSTPMIGHICSHAETCIIKLSRECFFFNSYDWSYLFSFWDMYYQIKSVVSVSLSILMIGHICSHSGTCIFKLSQSWVFLFPLLWLAISVLILGHVLSN
jgi:uncharacterized Fe-S cluster protein YjdI